MLHKRQYTIPIVYRGGTPVCNTLNSDMAAEHCQGYYSKGKAVTFIGNDLIMKRF